LQSEFRELNTIRAESVVTMLVAQDDGREFLVLNTEQPDKTMLLSIATVTPENTPAVQLQFPAPTA